MNNKRTFLQQQQKILITFSLPSYSLPIHPDTGELNVGGGMCVGALGAESIRKGATLDHVLEMQVVTGAGDIEIVSATSNPTLFNAVLGGLGQYAVVIWYDPSAETCEYFVRYRIILLPLQGQVAGLPSSPSERQRSQCHAR
jgi:hypothetical protein